MENEERERGDKNTGQSFIGDERGPSEYRDQFTNFFSCSKIQFDDRDKLCDIVCVPLIEMDRSFSDGLGYKTVNNRVLSCMYEYMCVSV